MPYITREDGEHFVIPSYRDVLAVSNKSALKRDILLLSESYGQYITLQKKGANQFEVAFSPDTGYLLGESIWHHFNRPLDMIYCEAIPNTTEALLVIVKSGSVYLDGSFPIDSISEELVIFLTQQNNFEIYTYGDVPISQIPEEGKFSFEASSVKSFMVLDQPVFATLPLLRIYQLQLVDQVLKEHGIGVFPIRQLLYGIGIVFLIWLAWSYFTSHRVEVVEPIIAPPTPNPYQGYNKALNTPAPNEEMKAVVKNIEMLMTMPGWQPVSIKYAANALTAVVQSQGSKTQTLIDWSRANNISLNIKTDGIYLTITIDVPNRPLPSNIYPVKQAIAIFVDRLSGVYPGNRLQLSDFKAQGVYTSVMLTITVESVTPVVLALIAEQFKDLPFVLQSMDLTAQNGNLSGRIIVEALGT